MSCYLGRDHALGGALIGGWRARSCRFADFCVGAAAHRQGPECVGDRQVVVGGTDPAGCWRAACTAAASGWKNADCQLQSPEAD